MPVNQTPKFVIMKKIVAPDKAPTILVILVLRKNPEMKPINKTLPQVQ